MIHCYDVDMEVSISVLEILIYVRTKIHTVLSWRIVDWDGLRVKKSKVKDLLV